MPRLSAAVLPLLVLFCSTTAAAQDFGTQWIDRVTHQILDYDAPLDPYPLSLQFSFGEVVTYDSNIFLTHTDRTNDTVFLTFGQVILKYAEVNWDLEADLTTNYNAYMDTPDANTDEERFFGRIRMQGSVLGMQLSEVARRESSPTDVVFTDRARRFISDTTPEIIFRLNDDFAMEGLTTIEYVHSPAAEFQPSDNINTRSIGTIAYTMKRNFLDAMMQVGYITIKYSDSDSPPDARGWLMRLGFRGDASPDLHVVVLAGVSHMESERDPITGQDIHLTTADVEIHLAYSVSETLIAYLDYTRRPGFSTGDSAFQTVDSSSAVIEYSAREDLKLRGRLQYDRVHTATGERRAYYSASVGPEFRLMERITLEAHATYRFGVAPGSNDAGSFTDAILALGIAASF
jgi:hypothetical protein